MPLVKTMLLVVCFFFFSSRRRHTRYWRDWSSDVCSSDLDVSVCAVSQRLERGAVPIGVVGLEGLVQAVEFDDDDALHEPGFIGFGGIAANQKIGRASCRERV